MVLVLYLAGVKGNIEYPWKTTLFFFPLYFVLGVRFPGLSSSVSFTSKGPTAGLVNVGDIPEESLAATEGELGQNGNNEVTFVNVLPLALVSWKWGQNCTSWFIYEDF